MSLSVVYRELSAVPAAVVSEAYEIVSGSSLSESVEKIFNSHLVRILGGTATLAGLALFSLFPFPLVVVGVGTGLCYALYYRIELVNEVALGVICYQNRTNSQEYPWCSQITDKILLSALPLADKKHNHGVDFKEKGIKTVLSVVTKEELNQPYLFTTPVSSEGWKEQGIEQIFIEVLDFHPLTQEQLEEGVAVIHRCSQEEGGIAVHCKAGKGRSACLVIAYLMKHLHLPLAEAVQVVQEKRPQLYLNPFQRKSLEDYQCHLIEA